ncbi:MAG: histidinol-phosphate transaminase [Ruminococcaceae bacterium]|nr:histidinol-phosphate transaminase [Oscillospiraceae bacterium]
MIQAKKALEGVAPYVPGRPISEIQRLYGLSKVVKLASNENPLGASPRAVEAIRRTAEQVFLYPDPNAYDLRMALSCHVGFMPEGFIFGTGSDGLIELICKTFLTEGDESLMPDPSFSLYELNVRAAGAVPVKVPLSADLQVSPLAMLPYITERTKVIWLCNPNNPTGGIYSEKEQLAFLEAVPEHILVVLDEAYFEYAKGHADYPDSRALLPEKKNLIILRTFSKIYGLAGLRVGYGMADPAVISEMEKVRAPFNVCLPAQAAATESLADSEFVARSVTENEANRRYLEAAFTRMGLSYIQSYTNFIAVNVNRDSKTVFTRLLEKGYIVKGGHVLGLPGYLRVTIGTREECEGFISALGEVLEAL